MRGEQGQKGLGWTMISLTVMPMWSISQLDIPVIMDILPFYNLQTV